MPKSSASHRSHSPEYALLGFLDAQPSHGYDLHRLLMAELGEIWHVSQSQTYNILKRLEMQGYISSTTVEQEKLPAIQSLKITTAGRRRFEAWLETPTGSSVRAIRLEFITRLYFAQKLAPERILPMLEAQAAEVRKALTWLEASQAAIPDRQLFNRLSLQLRIQQLKSVVDWLDECRKVF
ncbi:MAG: PadR family transcriptional regulator [Anaerolineales bacterium]|jgi:DNA-binding PadR family transcriptional regulator